MKIKDYSYTFSKEKYLKENIINYFKISTDLDANELYSFNEVLGEINQTNKHSIKYQ